MERLSMSQLVNRINRKGNNAVTKVFVHYPDNEEVKKSVVEDYLEDARRLLGYIEANMKEGEY